MNIFVTDPDPVKSAEVLPDKHIVKMPLETCQMLAVYSKWYFNWGNDLLPKKMENHTTHRRVHSDDIHALYGQQKVLPILLG